MERIIQFRPAYDKRDLDPKKNYGIYGVEIIFILKGEHGAVQFLLYTNWHLPHVQKEIDSKLFNPEFPYLFHKPQPADLGYHSYKPIREWQDTPSFEHCEILDEKPCYYDGSTLNAEPIFKRLLEEGDKGVWKALEDFYEKTFGELK